MVEIENEEGVIDVVEWELINGIIRTLEDALVSEEEEDKLKAIDVAIDAFILSSERKEAMCKLTAEYFDDSPGSSKYHHVEPLGMLNHIIEILIFGIKNYFDYIENDPEVFDFTLESFVIVAICHDIDRFGFYERKMIKATKEWRKKYAEAFGLDIQKDADEIPLKMPSRAKEAYLLTTDEDTMRHPSGAVYKTMKFVKLSEQEASAIDNHMLGFDGRTRYGKTPNSLSYFIGICDMFSACILGR